MKVYADTSFLLSLAIQDANHRAALAELARLGPPLRCPFSAFGEFEARNALRGLVARGHLTAADERAAVRIVRRLLVRGVILRRSLPFAPWFAEAGRLSALLTASTGARGLDVLHVAAARMFGAREFLSFDRGQRRFALAAGLAVRP